MSSFNSHALIALYWKSTSHEGCLLKAQDCLTGQGGRKDAEILIEGRVGLIWMVHSVVRICECVQENV